MSSSSISRGASRSASATTSSRASSNSSSARATARSSSISPTWITSTVTASANWCRARSPFVIGTSAYFFAGSGVTGLATGDLYRTDGTSGGTLKLTNLLPMFTVYDTEADALKAFDS